MERNVVKALFWRLGNASKREFLAVLICVSLPYFLVAEMLAATSQTKQSQQPKDARINTVHVEEVNNAGLNNWSESPPQPYDSLFNRSILQPRMKLSIFYYPATEDTNAIMDDFQQRMDPNMFEEIVSNHSSVGDMEKFLGNQFETNEREVRRDRDIYIRFGYGIIFNQVSKTKLSYTLRIAKLDDWETAILFSSNNEWKNYFEFGFITVQSGVNMGYMKYLNMTVGNWSFKTFPPIKGTTTYDNTPTVKYSSVLNELLFYHVIVGLFPLIFVFVGQIVTEKISGARELLRLNCVNDVGIYGYWFVYIIMECLISMTVLTLLLTADMGYHRWMPNSNPILVWTFLMLFTIHLSFMIFAFSSIFNNATFAAIIATVTICVLTGLVSVYEQPTDSVVGFLYVMTPIGAFRHGLCLILFLEKLEMGIHLDNLFTEKSDTGAGPMLLIIFGMIMGSVVFTLVFIYLDQVRPGEFGTAKPWHFIFGSGFIKKISNRAPDPEPGVRNLEDTQASSSSVVESADLPVGIKIRNLNKVFGTVKALNEFSIDFYQDQITVLLGHNGAGKTTLMSILTGLLSPTRGEVIVNNSNLFENMKKFRKQVGFCPQHDILLQDLSVQEQIIFFGMVRGLSKAQAREYARGLMTKFNIAHRKNSTPRFLSGGMKRKLCLAISLANDPKILLLDEPSSGLDPQSRRKIWDILLGLRGNRTVVISTHFMEEADVLGDKIAIMAHGQLRCYGSSMFLKQHFGTGHRITVSYAKHANVDRIKSYVMEVIPAVKIRENQQQNQIVFIAPLEDTRRLSSVFYKLEGVESSLGITEVGVSGTSVEELFLLVQEGEGISTDFDDTNMEKDNFKKTKGVVLVFQRFGALLIKRAICLKSTITFGICCLLIIPLLSYYLTFKLTKTIPLSSTQPLNLNLTQYGTTKVLVGGRNESIVKAFIERVEKEQSVPILSGNHVQEELPIFAKKDVDSFQNTMIVAADFIETQIAYFSTFANHGPAIAVNMLFNALINNVYPSIPKSIEVFNHPYWSDDPCLDEEIRDMGLKFSNWWLISCVGVLFSLTYFVLFPFTEKRNGMKQLQYMSGVSPFTYLACNMLFDFALFCIVPLVFFASAYALGEPNLLVDHDIIGLLLLTISLYGLAMIALCYLMTHLLKIPIIAINVLTLGSLGCAFLLMIVLNVVRAAEYVEDEDYHYEYLYLVYFSPTNPFGMAIYYIIDHASTRLLCNKCEQRGVPSEQCRNELVGFRYNLIRGGVISLVVDILLFSALTISLDYRYIQLCFQKHCRKSDQEIIPRSGSVDSDVLTEKNRVIAAQGKKSIQPKQESESRPIDSESRDVRESKTHSVTSDLEREDVVLIVDGLGKTYGRDFTAVRDVSFAAGKSECFGLLGVNGAGKTTTFSMLSGEIFPSHGDATLKDPSGTYTLNKSRTGFLQKMGYCPQENCLNEDMTGRQLLKLFALLRGASRSDSSKLAKQWIKNLDLHLYCDKPCGNYSGGNKRKLCAGIALIADPPVMLLDEPTTGVDPISKNKIWKIFNKIRSNDQTIILTSHSMDECEATCNRLTIMVAGRMRCIGTVQHLKQKFGQGFRIYIKIYMSATDEEVQSIKDSMLSYFGESCQLKDEYKGFLYYHLRGQYYKRSALFQKMTKIKRQWDKIEEYMLSDSSLEQVFLMLAEDGPKAQNPS